MIWFEEHKPHKPPPVPRYQYMIPVHIIRNAARSLIRAQDLHVSGQWKDVRAWTDWQRANAKHTAQLLQQYLQLLYSVMDTVVENRTVAILFIIDRSKKVAVYRFFPVFQKIEYRYVVSVFLGIPQGRMTVYVSELSRCFVDNPDNRVRCMYCSLYLVPSTVQHYTGHRNTQHYYVHWIWVGYPFSVWCMRVALPQRHHGPRITRPSTNSKIGQRGWKLLYFLLGV